MAATGRVLISAPTVEPVAITEAKNHLRVDTADDDALIQRCLVAARRWAEMYTRRAFVTQTWDVFYSRWSPVFEIPLPPLASITSVTMRTAADVALVVPADRYLVDTISLPGRVLLRPGEAWPSDTLWPLNPIVIRFVAGYGLAAAVPDDINAAILLLTGHLYENREQAAHPVPKSLPFAAEHLLMPHIAGWF